MVCNICWICGLQMTFSFLRKRRTDRYSCWTHWLIVWKVLAFPYMHQRQSFWRLKPSPQISWEQGEVNKLQFWILQVLTSGWDACWPVNAPTSTSNTICKRQQKHFMQTNMCRFASGFATFTQLWRPWLVLVQVPEPYMESIYRN
jgi:hypothetical protein